MWCLSRWVSRRCKGGDDRAEPGGVLLSHFMRSLRDEYLCALSPTDDHRVDNQKVVERIEALFNESGDDWERAYEIQRLLVHVKCSSKLQLELDRRIGEAEALKLIQAPKYRAQADAAAAALDAANARAAAAETASVVPGADQAAREAAAQHARQVANAAQQQCDRLRRAILSAVYDDLQWFYQKRNLVRKAIYKSADNLVCFGELTLLIAASPFFFFLIEREFGIQFFSKFVPLNPNYGLYTAASFGLVGAFFSRLLSIKFSRCNSPSRMQGTFSVGAH